MQRAVPFDKLNNVRDLGLVPLGDGRSLRKGILFRGDQLYPATQADLAMIRNMGITHVVDLRSAGEAEQKPDPEIPGVRNVHLPIIEDMRPGVTRDDASNQNLIYTLVQGAAADDDFVDNYMSALYQAFVTDPFASAQYARLIDEMLNCGERDEGILWHCTAGKDRAGFASIILLKAVGANDDTVMEDYLFTNERLVDDINNMVASLGDLLPAELEQPFRRVFLADETYLQAAYDAADRRYGGFDGYLEHALGIDGEKRRKLIDVLSE